jgi:hypothetical protein
MKRCSLRNLLLELSRTSSSAAYSRGAGLDQACECRCVGCS